MPSRRTDPKLKSRSNRGIPNWVIAVGMVAAVVVGIAVLFTLQSPTAPAYSPASGTSAGRTKGDPNAKLEFVVFSDFK